MDPRLLNLVVPHITQSGMATTDGHYELSNGSHARMWLDMRALLAQPQRLADVAMHLANLFRNEGIETVMGPPSMEMVGLVTLVALKLSEYNHGQMVHAIYPELTSQRSIQIGRNFQDLIEDKHVLILDPVLTTGTLARRITGIIELYGGTLVGVATIINRGTDKGPVTTEMLGYVPHLWSLLTREDLEPVLGSDAFQTWPDASVCELCQQGVLLHRYV